MSNEVKISIRVNTDLRLTKNNPITNNAMYWNVIYVEHIPRGQADVPFFLFSDCGSNIFQSFFFLSLKSVHSA